MSTFEPIRLTLVFIILVIALGPVSAQNRSDVFDNIERAIAGKEPGWILNKWPNPDPQYRMTMHQWMQSEKEINIWMIEDKSVEDSARTFYEIAKPGRSFAQLSIGDKCYVIISSASGMTLLMRKGNVVAKMSTYDSVSGPTAPQDYVLRFAQHIAAAVPSVTTALPSSSEGGGSAESHYRQGVDHLKAGDKTRAAEAFREAIRLRPEWAEAQHQLGTIYYESGDYKNAANAFAEAIRLQPEFFDALIALGKTYQHLGRHIHAVEVLQKAVLLRAENVEARTALGTALILAGQPQEAIAVLREAVRLGPESALIYATLGQAYRLSGKFDDALIALEQALRLHPEAAMVHYELGLTYLMRGDRNQAQAAYETLKRLQSDLADALLRKIRE
jgi:tetratricopeptide (TPR) repeat protein